MVRLTCNAIILFNIALWHFTSRFVTRYNIYNQCLLHESLIVSVQILILFYSMQEEETSEQYLPSLR